MSGFHRAHIISYYRSVVTMALSSIVGSKIAKFIYNPRVFNAVGAYAIGIS